MIYSKTLLTASTAALMLLCSGAWASGACGNPYAAPKMLKTTSSAPSLPATTASVSSVKGSAAAPAVVSGTDKSSASSNLSGALKEAVQNFEERYPKTQVKAFSLTPFVGLFEAAVGKEVIYFDKTARFLISGRLLDMERGQDLTDQRLRDLRRIDFDSLPLDKAVKTVCGSGKQRVAVFTDVDCPYSRKLSETMKDLKDTTVYTFLFPLETIHPQAREKSDAIWCAKNSSELLASALRGEKLPKALADNPLCPSVVNDILKLAKSHGIGGTPTLINEAGDRISGALPLAKLQDFISAPKAASSQTAN